MESKQPIFYFGNLDKSGFITEANDKNSTNYIIYQNDYLHKRVKELEDEVHELNSKITDIEEDNESLEISKTSLKGYVQNQGEYNKLSRNLVEIYNNAIGNISKNKEEIEWNIKFLGSGFIILEVSLFLFKLYNFDFFGIIEMLILNGFVWYIILKIQRPYNDIIKIRNIKNIASVIKIKEQLNETSKGNDYLSELIDKS